MSEPRSGMLRDRPVIETSVSWRLIWQLRRRMRRPDAAVARVPVRRRRLTCAGRSTVRPHAPTARSLVGAGTPPANRSKPSRNSRVEKGARMPPFAWDHPREKATQAEAEFFHEVVLDGSGQGLVAVHAEHIGHRAAPATIST